ncbi:class I SAM-dependent methyltransferase [Nonomuraea sp. NPDC050790]|uniref:class I SAM-dependent methyltransferase n=1 Tax=Nonomuraea sp. NPDC050790 TaxID=3364371 RepID=UPI00379E3A11
MDAGKEDTDGSEARVRRPGQRLGLSGDGGRRHRPGRARRRVPAGEVDRVLAAEGGAARGGFHPRGRRRGGRRALRDHAGPRLLPGHRPQLRPAQLSQPAGTHRAVIRLLVGLRAAKPALRVLDLGGGSGKNVATHFFLDTSMRWTYVDFCPGMAEQFQRHLAGQPLYERTKVLVEDINRVRDRVAPRSQDVILLNLVLSSMPVMPDFGRLAGLLAPGGTLIVCDIDPGYTEAHPLYLAMSTSGEKVGLRTRAVPPLAVAARADEAGLRLGEMRQVYADRLYSFVAVFVNAARVRGGSQERPAVEAPAS